jgi:hypothetical protein
METKTWFTTYCVERFPSFLSCFFFNLCFLHSWQTAIFLRSARWPPLPVNFRIKARLHLQLLLRFSSSDGCERVNKLWILWVYVPSSFIIWTFLTHSLVHIHQEKKIAAKIASVNAPHPITFLTDRFIPERIQKRVPVGLECKWNAKSNTFERNWNDFWNASPVRILLDCFWEVL